MFVKAPVATIHAFPFGCDISFARIATVALISFGSGMTSLGKSSLPSIPVDPNIKDYFVSGTTRGLITKRRHTMYARCMDSVPAKWFCSPGIYLDICSPGGFEYPERIDCCSFQRDIAMDSADAKKVQRRMMSCQKDSKCVLS